MQCVKSQSEERQALFENADDSRNRAIAFGAAAIMKLGSDATVVAGYSILILSVVLLVITAGAVTGGTRPHPEHRVSYALDVGKPLGVYFVKHEDRTWTREEFCNIETAARRYPEYNIFVINLLRKHDGDVEPPGRFECEESAPKARMECSTEKKRRAMKAFEKMSRQKLSNLSNVQNVDATVDSFFYGSAISPGTSNLKTSDIELAAKFQAIWDSPGVSLEPRDVGQLENVRYYLDESHADATATIEIDNEVQAASVSCQSFVGRVLGEIAKNDFEDRRDLLRRVLDEFCPSVANCSGVRIIKPIQKKMLRPDVSTSPLIDSISINDSENLIPSFE